MIRKEIYQALAPQSDDPKARVSPGMGNRQSTLPPYYVRLSQSTTLSKAEILAEAACAGEAFPGLLTEAVGILESTNPLSTLGTIAFLRTMGSIPSAKEGTNSRAQSNVDLPGVELLQALALRIPVEKVSTMEATPEQVQRLLDLLPEVQFTFIARRMSREATTFGQTDPVRALQEWFRLHTQGVRNWAYFDQKLRLLRDLCAPLDDRFRTALGFSMTEAVGLFEWMVRTSENRANARMTALRRAFRETSMDKLIRKYHQLTGAPTEHAETLLRSLRESGARRLQAKELLLLFEIHHFARHLTFRVTSAATQCGIPADVVRSVICRLSLPLGGLAGTEAEGLFLENPIWLRPLIRLSDNDFFAPHPSAFFSHSLRILANIVAEDESLKRAYHKRRAQYLQSATAATFRQAFPSAGIVEGYRWLDEGKEYETDLIVALGSHLLIVEAKGGGVTDATLRGGPDSIRSDVRKLILEPSQQSERLANRVRIAAKDPAGQPGILPRLPFDLRDVRVVLRLSVTLQDVATLQSRPSLLREAGMLPAEHRLSPCVQLTDLDLVFDALGSEYRRLHYLTRRAELDAGPAILSDELNLLSLYLYTSFADTAQLIGQRLLVVDMSGELDRYYAARAEGILIAKPRIRVQPWWDAICTKVNERRRGKWSQAIDALLSFGPDEQRVAEEQFRIVRHRVRRWRSCSDGECAVVFASTDGRGDALCLFAYRNTDHASRWERLNGILPQVFAQSGIVRCAVVGLNVDRAHFPYTFVTVATETLDPLSVHTDDLQVL